MQKLRVLRAAAETSGLDFIVVGGYAINAYGISRQTVDLDLLAPKEDREGWLKLLNDMGLTLRADEGSRLRFQEPQSAEQIDVSLVEPAYYHRVRVLSEHFDLGGGAFVRVPAALELLQMKLSALKRDSTDNELKDLLDVIGLIRAGKLDVHSAEFEELCRSAGPEGVLEKIRLYFPDPRSAT